MLPRMLYGEIFKYCPHEAFKCIRFLRLHPRVLEICLRPHFIARRDMGALIVRGKEYDIKKCIQHKWVEGYFYLCDKFNKRDLFIDEAVRMRYNVSNESYDNIKMLVKMIRTPHNFETYRSVNSSIIRTYRLPKEIFEYFYNLGYDDFNDCIFQNRWDLALKCDNKSITPSSFKRMSYNRAVKYIEFCKTNNLEIKANPSCFTDRISEKHMKLIFEYMQDKDTEVTISAWRVGYLDKYLNVKKIYCSPRERKEPIQIGFPTYRFMWYFKNSKLDDFEERFCESIKYINNREMKKIFKTQVLTEKIYNALIEHGRFIPLRGILFSRARSGGLEEYFSNEFN